MSAPSPTTTRPAPGTDGPAVVDPRRRTLILAAMCVALVAVVASVSGLNVAQGKLAVDLGATQSQLLWVINGYTIALAALLLPIGAIGDRWGRKPVLVSGLALFLGANAVASLSATVTQLLLARIAAGVGAAMIMPVTLSVITSTFPAEDRDRAVGVWAGFAGAGGILGLVGSSLVVDHLTWPWVFAGPIALGVVALVMAVAVVPHSREHAEGRFDTVGSILSALAVGGVVLGVHEGPEHGWSAPLTVVGLAVGLVAAVAFVAWELRQDHPLLALRVFRDRTLAAGSASLLVTFAVMGALFLVLVQFLQAVLGYSATRAAVSLLPMAAVMMPLSNVAPLIARRIGLRTILASGLLTVAGGLALMALLADPAGGYLSIVPGLFVLSVGIGLTMTPGTSAITGSLPPEEQGVASALNDTVRELGTALGVALIGSVLSAGYSSSIASATTGLPADAARAAKEGIGGAVVVAGQLGPQGEGLMAAARSAFVDGWTASMWLSAGLALAAAAFAFVWLPRRDTAEAATTATAEGSTTEAGDADRELVLA